jgi:PadR family transcriptional regulator, regulatory protein PadR
MLTSSEALTAGASPLDIPQESAHTPLDTPEETHTRKVAVGTKSEILQGTLDLMVLKTLDAMGPLHGYGIALRIEQLSEDVLQVNQGTVYASLVRLGQKGWIRAEWGTSENNRSAKYYSITARGRKQLAAEAEDWTRVSGVIGKLLQLESR